MIKLLPLLEINVVNPHILFKTYVFGGDMFIWIVKDHLGDLLGVFNENLKMFSFGVIENTSLENDLTDFFGKYRIPYKINLNNKIAGFGRNYFYVKKDDISKYITQGNANDWKEFFPNIDLDLNEINIIKPKYINGCKRYISILG